MGKLKGYTLLSGCGCSACETSLELVQNSEVLCQLYRPAPLALSFLATRRIIGIVKMSPVWWFSLLLRAFPPHLVNLVLTASPVNFLLHSEKQSQLCTNTCCNQTAFPWATSWLEYPGAYSLDSLTLGSSQKASVLLWVYWQVCQASSHIPLHFCFHFCLPLLLLGLKLLPNLPGLHFSLFVPSQLENVIAWQHNAKHSFSDTEQSS